jgi:uncharacterized protein YdiU (UPF0061 family)
LPSSSATLHFDNTFVRDLPGDPNPENRRRQVLHAAYSRVSPTAVPGPQLVAFSAEVAALLDLSVADMQRPELAQVLGGNALLEGMEPFAACYGGHQFGNWAGQLGDGRAISLGEVRSARGDRWELQLKGAGPTPYSRTADGRAVLRSSVREFLCSEAMHHLGVPTTRALSLVTTGERVVRDMFYDGNPQYEPGAVVCRVAPSFLRFGNFELPAARNDLELLRRLANYAITRHFPEIDARDPGRYLLWFDEICRRTVEMVVHWMRVGFVHGVMNTDNMSVLGLTIDYGPYGWLEDYDPEWTPNTTDAGGRRYRYGHQPRIALWNLSCLAGAILPLVGEPAPLEAILQSRANELAPKLQQMMRAKLGLREEPRADALAKELPELLRDTAMDMTQFFRQLATIPADRDPEPARLADWVARASDASYLTRPLAEPAALALESWLRRYAALTAEQGVPDDVRARDMNAVNPRYVLRNYMAQLAIDKAEAGDASLVIELLDVLRRPYEEQPGRERWAEKRPEWARVRAGCSMLSCSS